MNETTDPLLRKELRWVLDDRKHRLPGWTPAYLKRLVNVNTVIDIGVLEGTPRLYEAFPDAHLVLVEALPTYRETCEKILASRRSTGEIHMVAAGAKNGEATIAFDIDRPAISSLLTKADKSAPARAIKKFKVPVQTLDALFAKSKFKSNVLLKIDTEGMEHAIISGAPKFMRSVKYCITETSIKKRHESSYRFSDMVAIMKSNGFELLDIMTVTRAEVLKPGGSISDLLFVNERLG